MPKNIKTHECKKMKLAALERDLENPAKIEELYFEFETYLNQGQLEL